MHTSLFFILLLEPIVVVEDIVIKAVAVKEGYTDSDIAVFSYQVEQTEPIRYTVSFETANGMVVDTQFVEKVGG